MIKRFQSTDEEKFMKEFKSKTLTKEIDRIHGIEPVVSGWTDAKFSNLKKSKGSTMVNVNSNYQA